jgi:hypothetical protein
MRENAVEIIFVIPLERLQNYGMYITAAVKVARCNLKLWQVLDNIYNKNCERRRQYGEREREIESLYISTLHGPLMLDQDFMRS